MRLEGENSLLFIEPMYAASAEPVLDHLTRKMAAAFRSATRIGGWLGFHVCVCEAFSTCYDYRLPNGATTNSLCMHYLAHHRYEVPLDELAKIDALDFGEEEPTAAELQGPDMILARIRSSVETNLGADGLAVWTGWGLDVESLLRNLHSVPSTTEGRASARYDAVVLLGILSSIQISSLVMFKKAVEQAHGDIRKWGQRALRTPGWERELWVSPLLSFFQQCPERERGSVGTKLGVLGPAAGAAVPTLIELAKSELDCQYQHDLSLALIEIGRVLGRSLLSQVPARPGQIGICGYCNASGDCYCKRNGIAHPERCARCEGSQKCHVCKGTGR